MLSEMKGSALQLVSVRLSGRNMSLMVVTAHYAMTLSTCLVSTRRHGVL